MSAELYERQAKICAALANPVRLRILDLLGGGEGTATDLQGELGLPKSNLSQHLTVLKRQGILSVRGEGRLQHLRIAMPEVLEACALVRQMLGNHIQSQINLAKSMGGRKHEK